MSVDMMEILVPRLQILASPLFTLLPVYFLITNVLLTTLLHLEEIHRSLGQ